jgi:hypothetical protein
VTSLMLEHFNVPSSAQDVRLRERARREAIDGLAGRTVWFAAAVPERRSAAEALRSRLGGAGAGPVAIGRLDIAADGPLRDLARQLDEMLSGHMRGQRQLDAEQRELYAAAARDGERLLGAAVHHDDVVVVSDPFVAVLAEAARERGAIVVWQLVPCPRRPAAARAWSFIARSSPPIDAYVTSWRTPLPGGRVQSGVAAFIPVVDAVAAKEQTTTAGDPPWDEELGWSRLLSDIVRAGREEHVGGIVNARPAIAVR